MKPIKMFRFASALQIPVAALLFCGSPMHGQRLDPRLDPRTPLGAAMRAAAMAKATAAQDAAIAQALTVPPPTAVGTFVTFDVPGAVNGTFPASINDGGVITGSYRNNVGSGSHGFLRAANGTFVTFDVPGAVNGTFPFGINNGGVVTGGYGDNIGSGFHGFVRAANGAFVTFDAPGAVDGTSLFAPQAINAEGAVAGSYFDANFVGHSFLREPNGALTTFDPPGAVNGSFPTAITANGTILGVSNPFGISNPPFDSGPGFVRTRSGAFKDITGPGGLSGQYDPNIFAGAALSINPPGDIAGTYFQGNAYHVFLLSKNGQYTTFDAANYPPCCIYSSPVGINPSGTITGAFNDGFSIYHGFLRTRDGTVATFDAPGAGTGSFQGTMPLGITPGGLIAGTYVGPNDGNFLGSYHGHGFMFEPR